MSWKLLDKPKTVKVTKKLADTYALMDPAPHDRPLSERRLTVYRKILQDGGFRPVTWASARCHETGGMYRVNGKHTSVMLSSLPSLPEFYAVIEEYECDTLEDVARLYATFDSKMMSRTSADINMSFAATIPELGELARRTVNSAVAGMAFHLWHGRLSSTQPAERAELLLEHTDFPLWLHELAGRAEDKRTHDSKHLFRQPVVAAMFGCWLKAKAPTTEFWAAVRDESGAKPDLPDRVLARYLTRTTVDIGRGSRGTRHSDSREMYVKCLHAWNAWRKGETTRLNYHADAEVPSIK